MVGALIKAPSLLSPFFPAQPLAEPVFFALDNRRRYKSGIFSEVNKQYLILSLKK